MGSQQLSQREMDLLSAYIDGALSSAQVARIEQRIAKDERFKQAHRELMAMQNALRTLPAVHPPRSLRIDVQKLEAARGWRWWLIAPPGGQLIPSLSMIASVVVCLFAIQLVMGMTSAPVTPPLKGAALMSEAVGDVNDNQPESFSTMTEMADAVPLVPDEPVVVDITDAVIYGVVILSVVLFVASIRWALQIRTYRHPQRR